MVGDILTMVMVMVMATHITDMDITTLIIIIPITMVFHIIEVDETQIIIEQNLVEDQTFQHEIHLIAVRKQRVV